MGNNLNQVQNFVALFWGKADRKNPHNYHPLLYHLLDVANVALLLWQENLSTPIKTKIAAALGISVNEAGSLIAWLAGLHDLGKASPTFQNKIPLLAEKIQATSLKYNPKYVGSVPHGFISAVELKRILQDRQFDGESAGMFSRIAGAHHGTFPRSEDLSPININSDNKGNLEWEKIRQQIAEALLDALKQNLKDSKLSSFDHFVLPFLTGLISVADWIGSNEEQFNLESKMTLQEYLPISFQRARQSLLKIGWLPALKSAKVADFEEIFSYIPNLKVNNMQKILISIINAQTEPYLLIIEAPMGNGKTEAALFAADSKLCRDSARGFYIALPTQATSNAMYQRVKEFLERREYQSAIDLQLVHGNALLKKDDDFKMNETYGGKENQATIQSWFTARKRPLLAPFGVGTIDQSLLSVLQTRHWFVRLFGLAGKVVIFDEVHAYDTYMSCLLERLISWLAVLDCTVILLSATLPESKRNNLIKAYQANVPLEKLNAAYPRLTLVNQKTGSKSLSVPVHAEQNKRINLQFLNYKNLADSLSKALINGGCAAVICNTVKTAQEIFLNLQQELKDTECLIFHAKTIFGWRRKWEETVLEKFGKNGQRPRKAVLVATQVVEQSLDLDFDLMVSEPAPVDLLLQRAGRLHRHASNQRPVGLEKPNLYILINDTANDSPPNFGSSENVYDRYILLRSWLAIQKLPALDLPGDIEKLVNQVYEEGEPNSLNHDWTEALAESFAELENECLRDEKEASTRLIPEPQPLDKIIETWNSSLEEDDDPEVHKSLRAATRLGEPSINVICLNQVDFEAELTFSHEKVNLEKEPDSELAGKLLDASLSISHRGVYHHLLNGFALPASWAKNPHLRFYRLLLFKQGNASVGEYNLKLTQELGLEIRKGG